MGDQQILNGSLTTDFGDIGPGQTGTADFEMISSLQGRFVGFNASFTNDNALAAQETSLIDSVTMHDLIHCGEVGYVGNPAGGPSRTTASPISWSTTPIRPTAYRIRST